MIIFKLIINGCCQISRQVNKNIIRDYENERYVLREHILTMINLMKKLIGKLQTTTFKNGIMKDICYSFYLNNENFVNDLIKNNI